MDLAGFVHTPPTFLVQSRKGKILGILFLSPLRLYFLGKSTKVSPKVNSHWQFTKKTKKKKKKKQQQSKAGSGRSKP